MVRPKPSSAPIKERRSRKGHNSSTTMNGAESVSPTIAQSSMINDTGLAFKDKEYHVAGALHPVRKFGRRRDGSSELSEPPDSPTIAVQSRSTGIGSQASYTTNDTARERKPLNTQGSSRLAAIVEGPGRAQSEITNSEGQKNVEALWRSKDSETAEDIESLGGDDELSDGVDGADGDTDYDFRARSAHPEEQTNHNTSRKRCGHNDLSPDTYIRHNDHFKAPLDNGFYSSQEIDENQSCNRKIGLSQDSENEKRLERSEPLDLQVPFIHRVRHSQDFRDDLDIDMLINAYVDGQTQFYEFEEWTQGPLEAEVPKILEGVKSPDSRSNNAPTPIEDTVDVPEATTSRLIPSANELTVESISQAITPVESAEDPEIDDEDYNDSPETPGTMEEDDVPGLPTANDAGIGEETDALLAAQLGVEEGLNADETDDVAPIKKQRFEFRKLTDYELIREYLQDSQSMSYVKLYHRTARVSSILQEYEDEMEEIQKELNAFDAQKKAKAKIAEEDAKALKEKARKDEDAELLRLWEKFGERIQGLKLVHWNEFKESFARKYPEEDTPGKLDFMLKLRNVTIVNALLKRSRQEGVPEERGKQLIDAPPPTLSRSDLKAMEEGRPQLRKLTIDPIVFEDRKMADVYGFEYQSGQAFHGNQPLVDRNNLSANVDERTTRTRGKRKFYESEANEETTGLSDQEELPAKRKRVARVLDDGPDSPSRVRQRTAPQSRDGSPAAPPRTFASGKRVGRPPGSKTKSKLNAVVAAEDMAETDYQVGEEPLDEPMRVKSNLKLEPVDESDLADAAESTVKDDSEAEDALAPLPQAIKKKHAAGRSKGNGRKSQFMKHDSEAMQPTDAGVSDTSPVAKKKRRTKKIIEEAEIVLPSTEKEDVSTSRSGTPSSAGSASHSGSAQMRRSTRASSREQSRAREPDEIATPRSGKRKRLDTIAVVPAAKENGDSVPTPIKKRKINPSAQTARKRKSSTLPSATTISVETIAALEPSLAPTIAPAAPKRQRILPPTAKKIKPKASKASDEEGSVFEGGSGDDSGPVPKAHPRAIKKTSQSSATAPVVRRTGRERKLTGRALALDGAGEDETESDSLRNQFASEYERFQALTSPGSPLRLGKRARKTRVELSFEESEEGDEEI